MRERRSDDAIRLSTTNERGADVTGADWGLIRAVYMRILGIVWLAKGLYGGALLIGLFGYAFDQHETAEQACAVFSAIGDCIAGVGLWLTVEWGAVTWIAVILVEIGFAQSGGPVLSPTLAALVPVVIYLAIGFLNARQAYDRE
jgi:hypothetical protein